MLGHPAVNPIGILPTVLWKKTQFVLENMCSVNEKNVTGQKVTVGTQLCYYP